MASTRAILAAAKAAPAGRPTPAPQGATPYFGAVSPVAAQLDSMNGYASTYGSFLPRPPATFTQGAFGPFSPILPVPVDTPDESGRAEPRREQFEVGWNLPVGQPGSEGLKLACYSDDTEVLTRRGWSRFSQLHPDDVVATRDPVTKRFEWQQPTEHHSYQYDGELIRFTSRGIDLLVTPNHRVLHTSGHGAARQELVKRADECEELKSGAMIATSEWVASDLEWWSPPERQRHGYVHIHTDRVRLAREARGWTRTQLAQHIGEPRHAILRLENGTARCHVATMPRIRKICEALELSIKDVVQADPLDKISGDDFAAFMGAYLSEGCVSIDTVRGHPVIYVSQMPYSKGFEPFREMLTRILGREPSHDGKSWFFTHDGLASYLQQCGHRAHCKRIPADVMEMSSRQLRIFWDFYLLGDGYFSKNTEVIVTSSAVMAGQLQEVAQKIGLSATAYQRKPQVSSIRGREVPALHPCYDVFLRTTKQPKWTATERIAYSGTVYCVSVPNGIVYVRRNGKAIWSGNSFSTLRTLADLYSVARACIQLRKTEVQGLEWDIMPTADAAKANKGNEKWFRDFGQRRQQAMKFLRRPDPDYFSWTSFISAFLEEIFVFDALSLYLRPKRGKGMRKGLFGSDLDCVELISGPTIRPLYGIHGEFPRPPAPAYQQYLYGVPRSDFMMMLTDRDIEEAGLSGQAVGQFAGDQLLYLPMVPRRWTPYGFAPIERAMIPVMSGLQKQGYALDFFREGTVPAVYMSPGDESMTPNQIRELQDALNAFAGDPAMHHKIIVLPPGSKVMPQRDAQLADQFDDVVMTQVTMAFDVMPMELGISPKVSTTQSPGAANQMAKMTQAKSERKSTKPLLVYIADIFNAILQDVCHQDDMKFVFEGLQEEEDQEQLTTLLTAQIGAGLRSIDEGRDELNLQPWGLPETSGPIVITPTGPVSLAVAMQQAAAAGAQAALPPGQKPGSAPPVEQGGDIGGSGDASAMADQEPKPANPKPTAKPSKPAQQGDTPGHAAAESADATAGAQSSRGSSSASGKHPTGPASGRPPTSGNSDTETDSSRSGSPTKPAPKSDKMVVTVGLEKAVNAELEALARHLRKGRLISTWEPKNIPPRTLAVISEGISKGLSVDQAVTVARVTTLEVDEGAKAAAPGTPPPTTGPTQSEPTPQQSWPGWERDALLAALYAPLIERAFHAATGPLKATLAGVLRGSVAMTRQSLKLLLHDVLAKALLPTLHGLWREAWVLGDRSATALVARARGDDGAVDWGRWMLGKPATAALGDTQHVFDRTLTAYAPEVINGIADTRLDDVLAALGTADNPADLAASMAMLLDVSNRARLIADTEVANLSNMATTNRYGIAGVTKIEWLTEPGACRVCMANRDGSPIDVGDVFPSNKPCPPQHPRCRCSIAPTAFAGDLSVDKMGPKGYSHGWVKATPEQLAAFVSEHEATKDPDVEMDLSPHRASGHVTLSLIRTKDTDRGQGKADAAMRHLTSLADKHGVRLSLTPEPLAGDRTTKKARLTQWYKSHGFIANSGSHKDYEVSDTMIRDPKLRSAASDTEKLVRAVPLNGEATWTDPGPAEPNAAGGGGQSPVRHWGDGTQAPDGVPVTGGVPGASAGGEPPRWDTPVANGYQGGLNDLSDQRQANGVDGGDDGLRSSMDDGHPVDASTRGQGYPTTAPQLWPQGGQGTTQAGNPAIQVPGDEGNRSGWGVREKFDIAQPRGPHGRWIGGAAGTGTLERPRMSSTQARNIVHDTHAHGGSSVNPFTGHHPMGGFMVADKDGSHIIDAKDFYGAHGSGILQDYVAHHGSAFADPDTHLGTWHDTQSGKVFLDVSHNVQDRNQAIALGRQNNQIAIWDVAGAQEIPTGGTGGLDKAAGCSTCGLERAPHVSATREFAKHLARQGKTFATHYAAAQRTEKGTGPIAAGIAVRAADTGRVLMLQRAMDPAVCTCGMPVAWDESNGWQHADGSISHEDDDTSVSDRMGTSPPDPATGMWEFPGGCLEDDEPENKAAKREWEEETGIPLPEGEFSGQWDASNGKYHGYVYTVAHEADVPIHDGRDEVINPDDPDGDAIESLAWWEPAHLVDNPAVRTELACDLPQVFAALGEPMPTVDKTVHGVSTHWPVAAPAQVKALMRHNFPDSALGWVDDAQWRGPCRLNADMIDFSNRGSWAAHHESDRIQHFVDRIQSGDAPHPVILVDTPGEHDLMVVDGHHRALAYRQLGKPIPAYVGRVDAAIGPWDETHLYQVHQGDDAANKRMWNPLAHPRGAHGRFGAGAASPHYVEGAPQRPRLHTAEDPDFSNLESDDFQSLDPVFSLGSPRLSAARLGPPELSHEDTKREVERYADSHPELFTKGTHVAVHEHQGKKRLVRAATAMALAATLGGFAGGLMSDENRAEVPDPGPSAAEMYNEFHDIDDKDDPFLISPQLVATARKSAPSHAVVSHVSGHAVVRLEKDWAELTDAEREAFLEDLLAQPEGASKSAETPTLAATPHLLGTHGLWGDPDAKLPNYIEQVAAGLMRDGHDESSAIRLAVGAIERWKDGGDHVTPEVQAASAAAWAEWERLRAEHGKK